MDQWKMHRLGFRNFWLYDIMMHLNLRQLSVMNIRDTTNLFWAEREKRTVMPVTKHSVSVIR